MTDRIQTDLPIFQQCASASKFKQTNWLSERDIFISMFSLVLVDLDGMGIILILLGIYMQ